ncbi:MAG: aminopeptidase P family protein [Duncaniella sp.]|nr:aminopeptidase P family protein [Duncaniella sp.]
MNDIVNRINAYRAEMTKAGVAAALLPRTDDHLSEYISAHWHIVRYLSGFTGSAATMVITMDKALLWTDSRYFLQAAVQLEGTGVELMKDGLPETPSYTEWLADNLPAGSAVGINGLLISINDAAALAEALAKAGISLDTGFDPTDKVWTDRPAPSADKAFVHDVKYAGESAPSRMERVLEETRKAGARSYLVSPLDETAWILNLRGSDVPHNLPVATAFLYLAPEGSVLFIDEEKMTPEVKAHLDSTGVATRPYSEMLGFLSRLPEEEKVLVSGDRTPKAVADALEGRAVKAPSPLQMLKAVKNATQIEGVRNAHIRDGVAMVRSLMEIEALVKAGKTFTELDAEEIILRHRKEQDLFMDVSFDTIAGFGPNGAIVHYSATPETNATVAEGSLLLLDSGGNYLDATTDITRTIAIGKPTAEMRHDFTLVMKGHIAIATAIFPEGTRGHQLDAMARMPLWKEGKSYLHGTGHGVGLFLSCHEGPQSIRLNDTMAPLVPGMLTSNEPGLYLSGRYGIRCENLVLTVDHAETEFGKFYAFETVTLCPFDLSLFDTSIMTADEIGWVNDYHARVCRLLSPALDTEERQWLEAATKPLV